jgi:hypothetical protein
VDQFVSEESLPVLALQRRCVGSKDDVLADRERPRVHETRGSRGGSAGVHSHAAEVMTQAGLHRSPHGRVEGLADLLFCVWRGPWTVTLVQQPADRLVAGDAMHRQHPVEGCLDGAGRP